MQSSQAVIEPAMELRASEIVKASENMASSLKIVKITSPVGYIAAGEYRIKINRQLKDLEEIRLDLTRPLMALKKKWDSFFQGGEDSLKSTRKALDTAILDYEAEERRKRQQAEEKARQEALRREEAERKKIEEQAKKAEKKGNFEKAEELRQMKEEVYVAPAVIEKELPKVDGLQTRDQWKFEIIDPNLIPREYMIPDMIELGKTARATKGKLHIPGVRIFNDPIKAG